MCDRPLQYKRNRRSHLLKLVFSKNVAFFNLVPLQVCGPKAWFQSMFCMFMILLFNQTPDVFLQSICAPHFSLVPKALLLLMTLIHSSHIKVTSIESINLHGPRTHLSETRTMRQNISSESFFHEHQLRRSTSPARKYVKMERVITESNYEPRKNL